MLRASACKLDLRLLQQKVFPLQPGLFHSINHTIKVYPKTNSQILQIFLYSFIPQTTS